MPTDKPMSHTERRTRRRTMAHLIGKGRSLEEVATQFCVTPVTVYGACREFSQPIRRTKKSEDLKNQKKAEIVKNLLQHEPVEVICAKFNCTKSYVTRIRNAHNIAALRKGYPAKPTTYAIIADLINGNGSIGEIAIRYGISHQRIHQHKTNCIKYNIDLHKRYGKS